MRLAALLSVLTAVTSPAFAQNVLPVTAPVIVTNTPSNPVPVTGTVRLDGGVGAVTGTMKSGDTNATLHDAPISVTTTLFANHETGPLDVGGYKEVRVMVSRSSCGPCGNIVAGVFVSPANGLAYQIDEFPVGQPGDSFPWSSRTYTVPGSKLFVALRATAFGTNNSVRVGVLGRAN